MDLLLCPCGVFVRSQVSSKSTRAASGRNCSSPSWELELRPLGVATPRYLTPDDTHDCCVFCLGEEHARGVFEGAICVHCELFSMRKLRSRLSLVSRKEGQPSASRDSGPTATEAQRRMKSWGSQADLADELERELSLSHESAGNEGEPLDYGDTISLTSSDPAASALLGYAQKEQEMSEGEEAETELSQTSCPAYEELLEVMERANRDGGAAGTPR